jgi:pseudouridine-5'-phosphate glycosidase
MPAELYDRAISQALADADTSGVRGRTLTPFLLERMREVTGGDSVRANVALLRNNARVAAELAVVGV